MSEAKLEEAPLLGNLRRAGQGLVALYVVAAAAAAWRWRHEFDPATLAELMRTPGGAAGVLGAAYRRQPDLCAADDPGLPPASSLACGGGCSGWRSAG